MKTIRVVLTVFALALLVLFAGCASTPQASADRDAEAKQFGTHPDSSTIYVFRTDLGNHEGSDHVLWIDSRLVGSILPRTYFRVNVDAGKHTLNGMGVDNGRLALETRPGELYFVSMTVVGNNSQFRLVPAKAGKQAIAACCALLENWTAGQRPLIR